MNGAVIKLGIHIVSSLGVSKVLSDIIENNTTIVTTMDKVLVKSGTLVLGTMVGGQAMNHVTKTIDGVVNMFNKSKDESDNNPKEVSPDPAEVVHPVD